jgi:hypothetical protein
MGLDMYLVGDDYIPTFDGGSVPSVRVILFQATAWTWVTGVSMRLCTATS